MPDVPGAPPQLAPRLSVERFDLHRRFRQRVDICDGCGECLTASSRPPCPWPAVFQVGDGSGDFRERIAPVDLRAELVGAPGTDTPALVTTGRTLVTVRDWTFLLGPGLMPGINALMLGLPDVPVRPGATADPRARAHRSSFAHRFDHRSILPRRPPDRGPGGDRDRPDPGVGAVAWPLADRQGVQAVPHHRWHDGPDGSGVAVCKPCPMTWYGHKDPGSSMPECVSANGFANETGRDGGDDMRHRRRPATPSPGQLDAPEHRRRERHASWGSKPSDDHLQALAPLICTISCTIPRVCGPAVHAGAPLMQPPRAGRCRSGMCTVHPVPRALRPMRTARR
jgi:hypothetical protein